MVSQWCNATVVEELIDQVSKVWNVNALRTCLAPESAIEALKTPISVLQVEDELFWPLSKDGIFSVRSGYRAIKDSCQETIPIHTSSFLHSEVSWQKMEG